MRLWEITLFLRRPAAFLIATLLGLPLVRAGGCAVQGTRRRIGVINTMMGLPPVVVGLFVYMMIRIPDRLCLAAALYAHRNDHRPADLIC